MVFRLHPIMASRAINDLPAVSWKARHVALAARLKIRTFRSISSTKGPFLEKRPGEATSMRRQRLEEGATRIVPDLLYVGYGLGLYKVYRQRNRPPVYSLSIACL